MLPNAKVLLNQAWGIYKKRARVSLGIMIPPVIFYFLPALLIALGTNLLNLKSPLLGALGIGTLILSPILALGGIVIQLWSQTALLCAIKDREENIGVKESYRRGWNKIISYFWVSFLSGIIISVGLFLFLVPGLIFFVWFSMASFVFISENKKGWSALMASKSYVKGNWRGVFWRFAFIGTIAYLFLYLFSILPDFVIVPAVDKIYLYVGYILVAPLVTIYSFLIYENLKKLNPDNSAVQSLESEK